MMNCIPSLFSKMAMHFNMLMNSKGSLSAIRMSMSTMKKPNSLKSVKKIQIKSQLISVNH